MTTRFLARAAERRGEIIVYAEIGPFMEGVTHASFAAAMRELGSVDQIDIRLNSYGGDTKEGIGIYNSLMRWKRADASRAGRLSVYVDGVAASIASIIAMAGDRVLMARGALMMIHQPFGFVMGGTKEDMRRESEALARIQAQMRDIYAERTGIDPETIDGMMAVTTWMTAREAIEYGFADDHEDARDADIGVAFEARAQASVENLLGALTPAIRAAAPAARMAAAMMPPPVMRPPVAAVHAEPVFENHAAGHPSAPPSPQAVPAPIGAARHDGGRAPTPSARSALDGLIRHTGKETAMDPVQELRERYETVQGKMVDIQERARAQGRAEFTEAEQAEIDGYTTERDMLKRQIATHHAIAAGEEFIVAQATGRAHGALAQAPRGDMSGGAAVDPASGHFNFAGRAPDVVLGTRDANPMARGDFRYQSLGHYAADVARYARKGIVSQNLSTIMAAAGDMQSGSYGTDGGFLIAPDFRQEIYSMAIEQDPIIQRCWTPSTNAKSVQLPVNETQVWEDVGVTATTTKEGAQITPSKDAFVFEDIKLHAVKVLVRVPEELLEDAPMLDAFLRRRAVEEINWKVTKQIFFGSGAGEALGIFNSPALHAVPKETGQANDTIVAENVLNMEASMPARMYANAVWLHSNSALPFMRKLIVKETSEVFGMDRGDLRTSIASTVSGRPALRHEIMRAVGDLGDILLADFSQYVAPIKSGGIREARSMHFEFDRAIESFRFTFRFGGQPLWTKKVLSNDGATYLSPFITLAAR